MKSALVAAFVLVAASANDAVAAGARSSTVVVRWNQALLQAVRETRMAPPQTARALAILHTCMYDAWAAYDAHAVGTRMGEQLRRPFFERTEWNKTEAIGHAAYRAAVDLFPSKRESLFDPLMMDLGYWMPSDSTDVRTPAGIGNVAAAAVIAFRHDDGSNQLGTMTPGGVPYADSTGYAPVNDPFTMTDPSRWQPLLQPDGQPQRFLVQQWGAVVPFALTRGSQFRPPAPATYETFEYRAQAIALIVTSATRRASSVPAAFPSTDRPPNTSQSLSDDPSAATARSARPPQLCSRISPAAIRCA